MDTAKHLKTFASGLKQRMAQFQPQRGSFTTYLMALALMGFALWVRLAIAPVEAGLQYVTFFPAVTLAAIVGGLWPGLFTTVIGLLLATYIFTPPYYSFSSEALQTSFWSNIVFSIDGLIVCLSIEVMHRYRSRHAGKLAEVQAQHEQARQLQKETEALLRRNQILMQNSADGIHVMDMRGNIVEANDAFCRMLGYTREEAANLNVADWDAQWSAEELQRQFKALIDKSAKFETEHRRKDGSLINVEISASGIKNEDQYFLLDSSRDITERKRAEQALLEADRHKNEFLAMLAHELRNPLAPIRNAAHVLGKLEQAEPRVKWAHEVIERQVMHITRLVDDLLDVSRIVSGKVMLKRENIEFAALAEQVMQAARPLAEGKGQSLEVRLPGQPVQLEGDPVRLSQVLFNLLDNAIKYTPEDGRIEFSARLDGLGIEISVCDNGMGITPELLPRVFDLFQQDERKLDRAHGGLGIGLTLVQRLAEMHGGRVKAHSAGPGQGSTFTVWLPAKATLMPAPSHRSEAVSSPATGLRVLVVDDDFAVANSTAVLLEMDGHLMCIAESGPAALEQVVEFRPQVVLLDIGLKGMDGFEIAQRLRQMPEGRDLCLVAVTGYAESAIRERALASGCDHFLVKPVKFKSINDLLSNVVVRKLA